MENIVYHLILWGICGAINVLCIYLAGVVYRRPDFANEFIFFSPRTLITFMLGAIATPFIWIAPAAAYQDFKMYKRVN